MSRCCERWPLGTVPGCEVADGFSPTAVRCIHGRSAGNASTPGAGAKSAAGAGGGWPASFLRLDARRGRRQSPLRRNVQGTSCRTSVSRRAHRPHHRAHRRVSGVPPPVDRSPARGDGGGRARCRSPCSAWISPRGLRTEDGRSTRWSSRSRGLVAAARRRLAARAVGGRHGEAEYEVANMAYCVGRLGRSAMEGEEAFMPPGAPSRRAAPARSVQSRQIVRA